ncbi:MAG: pantoate--beta-alanine ligase, partial [Dehalococcoidia bacterium]|nr:pantoate--beta-alanine ligase [Dehalococcoidia bacterium]
RKKGNCSAGNIRAGMMALLRKEPLMGELSYVSIADPESLTELDVITDKALVSLAVKIGKTRLIDNITIG